MGKDKKSKQALLTLIATGVISLIAGVAGGVLIYRLTVEQPVLEYDLIESETFSGETQSVAIIALKIYNSGNKEAEDFTARLTLDLGAISDHKISGLPKEAYAFEKTDTSLLVTAPFFNDGEALTMQVLANTNGFRVSSSVDVRAKGVRGEARDVKPDPRTFRQIAVPLATLCVTMLIFSLMQFSRRYRLQLQ